jgi:hypothetical protein
MTDEQRCGRPKDRPLRFSTFSSLCLFILLVCPNNAAAGIYEMASKQIAVVEVLRAWTQNDGVRGSGGVKWVRA